MLPHPIAAMFPMLSQDDLSDLAEDIKVRGLLYPIVLNKEGQILDGRNRLKACEIAGVEPTFSTYEGNDPTGYIFATNINRRHLTKGQQAMILVKAENSSVSDAYRRTKYCTRSSMAQQNSISATRLKIAQLVLDHAPEFVDTVISGMVSLDAAYRTAKERKDAAEDRSQRIEALKRHFGDMAARVEAEEMTFEEALAEAAERQHQEALDAEERKRQQKDISTSLARSIQWLAVSLKYPAGRASIRNLFDQKSSEVNFEVTLDTLQEAQAGLKSFVEEWDDNHKHS